MPASDEARLLRGPRRRSRRRATRSSRRPTASSRSSITPTSNPGDKRGGGALQGGSARPTRSSPTPSGARSTIASATPPSSRAAARPASTSAAGFEDIFGDLFGDFFGTSRGARRRARPRAARRGPALRPRPRASRRPRSAARRPSRSRAWRPARRAAGSGAQAGHRADDLPAVPRQRADALPAGLLLASPRPAATCSGQGTVIARSVRRRAAAPARVRRTQTLQRQDPRRRRHRLAPEAARRGRERRRRRAAGRSLRRRSRSREHPLFARDGQRRRLRRAGQLRAGGARHRDRGPDARGQAQAEDPGRHAVGRAVPAEGQGRPRPAAATVAATSWCASSSRRRASSRRASASCSRSSRASRGEEVHPALEELPREGEVDARVGGGAAPPATSASIAWIARLLRSAAPRRRDRASCSDRATMRPPSVRPAAVRSLLTTDTLVEGVHFRARLAARRRALGRRAMRVNLSDVAAMGGRARVARWSRSRRRRRCRSPILDALVRRLVADGAAARRRRWSAAT